MTHRPTRSRNQFALTRTSSLAECDARLVGLLHPDSYAAEQFRCLRYSLLRTLTGRRSNVIAVSSPEHGSGRTTTAINLAVTLQEMAVFRVLLVDADLRGAAIADHLGLGDVIDDGLDAALANRSLKLQDVVRRFPHPDGFGVLPTAARPDIAHRLIASPRLGMLLQEAREQYDFVIVDTPPLLPAADCRAMAPWMDGFVIVVAAHKTLRKALEESLKAMSEDQVLGLVLTGDDASPWFSPGSNRART